MSIGQHSQFVVVPSRVRISELFEAATGVPLEEDSTWTKWIPLPPTEAYAWLLEYIRPCHQQILQDTLEDKQPTPAALFRQLLRPFDLTIKVHKKGWILNALQPPSVTKTVEDKPGVTIVWS
jgi:hypothetical protein